MVSPAAKELRIQAQAFINAERSALNEKAAWCMVLPFLGWFGRADRIERRHAQMTGVAHALIDLEVRQRIDRP